MASEALHVRSVSWSSLPFTVPNKNFFAAAVARLATCQMECRTFTNLQIDQHFVKMQRHIRRNFESKTMQNIEAIPEEQPYRAAKRPHSQVSRQDGEALSLSSHVA